MGLWTGLALRLESELAWKGERGNVKVEVRVIGVELRLGLCREGGGGSCSRGSSLRWRWEEEKGNVGGRVGVGVESIVGVGGGGG